MQQYADAGLDMMHEHAQFEDGNVSVEAGLMDMVARMRFSPVVVIARAL